MIIEKFDKQDVPQLVELYKELTPFENSLDSADEFYRKIAKNPNYLLLTAKENNEIIGSACGFIMNSLYSGGKPILFIDSVVVKQNSRRMGIGSNLFFKLDEFAKKNHASCAIFVSTAFRVATHEFYKSVGFINDVRGFRKEY
ncbi:Predicted N-acetyltransferase YhbS [Propionispira arboris]|uniref:Predicted N-acetyltransferase YhbS n=1 Tax=Propionispira arboris TaxID=84035 RepID=A0A1H6W354_9FIRM|nr:GNAT family N-acetyltransferase [Propionispira arboris]SEJ09704.1 Predicted N-acetyltransferase YhbS [Propionispira arboris]